MVIIACTELKLDRESGQCPHNTQHRYFIPFVFCTDLISTTAYKRQPLKRCPIYEEIDSLYLRGFFFFPFFQLLIADEVKAL